MTGFPPGSRRTSPRRHHSRWHGHLGLRTLLYIAAVLLVGAMVLLVAAGDPDTSADTERNMSGASPNQSIITGLGYPGEPLDQPIPVPSRDWQGWEHYSTGRCAWMPSGLLSPLEPVGPPRPTTTGCTVTISSGGTVYVNWGAPEKRLRWYSTNPGSRGDIAGELTTVAGLEARTTKPFLLTTLLPGICRVDVNTRSITGLSVLVWNPDAAPDGCKVAESAANLVARALVPASGGTPWADTPQHPTPLGLVGRGACELLIAGMDRLDNLASGLPVLSRSGSTQRCGLVRGDTEVQAWMTSSGGDPDLPDAEGARVRWLGPLRAWEEEAANTCTITTEVLAGHHLAVSYHDSGPATAQCALSELIAANAIHAILDRSTP